MHSPVYMPDMMQTTGQRIRAARKAAGLAQDDIAIACGVRRLTVSSWEAGRTSPRAEQLVLIAKRVRKAKAKVTAAWLLTGEGKGPLDTAEVA